MSVAVLVAPFAIPIDEDESARVSPATVGLSAKVTLPLSVPAASAAIAADTLPPGGIVTFAGVAVSVNPAVILTAICAVAVFPLPSVPDRLIV